MTAIHDPERAAAASSDVRRRRAAVKAAIAAGDTHPATVLHNPPWYMRRMRVLELLEVCPGVGSRTLRRLNFTAASASVNLLASLEDLTDRQRAWLIGELPRLQRASRVPLRRNPTT